MLKPLPFAAVLLLIAGGALVHGAVTLRWDALESTEKRDLTAKLHALDLADADWRSEVIPTDMPTNERSTATSRRYTGPANRVVSMSLISGIPGSVATHTPDVCYPGSGYKTLRGPKKEAVSLPNGQTGELYVADFEKKTQTRVDRVRVRWAWTVSGEWVAPDSPRWAFAKSLRAPTIYKVYVVTLLPEVEGDAVPEEDAVTKAFAQAAWAKYAAAFAP
jgi:hypothetical protein